MRISTRSAGLLGAAALVMSVGAAPLLVTGADHLDAPALGGISDASGDFSPHSEHPERDINDVYAFQGANASRTVLALTTHPALFSSIYATDVRYIINVDRDGDAVQDLAYVVRFLPAIGKAGQPYLITRYTGGNARNLSHGNLRGVGLTGAFGGQTLLKGDGRAFAGPRSDPFFFDLIGFAGTVLKVGDGQLGQEGDFFAGLNTNAIVIEVPDDQLGTKIGVWGQTTWWDGSAWRPGDQMGRPAISTVFNNKYVGPSSEKDAFNATPPSQQRTALNGKFRSNIVTTLTNINGILGTGKPDYDPATAGSIADLLLPDVLTYDTSTNAAGPLNGRALADDVIDIELGLTTNGSVKSDGVSAHTDYLSSFPYLGVPH